MIRHLCLCECGCQRPQNQDRAGAWAAGDCGLFFVADGVGGRYAGERASQTIADALAAWWGGGRQLPVDTASDQLWQLIESCHTRIASATPPGRQCGSTLALLWISGGAYTLLWAGDSRIYHTRRPLLRARTTQLTSDDTEDGKLRRAVGIGQSLLSMRSGICRPGDLFALCSDGVYNYCPPDCLHHQLARAQRGGHLPGVASAIEAELCARQAPDNYSLVLVHCE